jgi:hypothetical protein
MLCGNPLAPNPKVLDVVVNTEAQAWAINHANEALSQGDEDAATAHLRTMIEELPVH